MIKTDDSTSGGGLWAGFGNEQVKGDDLASQQKIFPLNLVNYYKKAALSYNQAPVDNSGTFYIDGGLLKHRLPNGTIEVLGAATGGNTTTTTGGTTTTTASGFNFAQFFAENKLLVLGGAAAILWLLFSMSQGGGLAEKSVITRYNKR
jgi:hypothetical protein